MQKIPFFPLACLSDDPLKRGYFRTLNVKYSTLYFAILCDAKCVAPSPVGEGLSLPGYGKQMGENLI